MGQDSLPSEFITALFGRVDVTWSLILPETILALTAVVLLIWDMTAARTFSGALRPKRRNFSFVLISMTGVFLAWVVPCADALGSGFANTVIRDGLAVAFENVFLAAAFLCILFSKRFLDRRAIHLAEYYVLVLLATSGMILMAKSGDFITLFLGLELLSICLYVLAGVLRSDRLSIEAAFKYFILGAFSTGFLVFGMAMLFGTFGTTNFALIIAELNRASMPGINPYTLYLGIALVFVGLGFKVSLVPFHFWAPDVYQGAPTPVTALIATGSKLAGFAALARIFAVTMPFSIEVWGTAIAWLVVLTMLVGNLMALVQEDVKRMLAYSSVAHGGYLMLGFLSQQEQGTGLGAVIFYAMAYTLMTMGAFGVLILVGRHDRDRRVVSDLNGLADASPTMAAAMTVFLLSLAGMPLTAGFVGKLFLFGSAIQAGYGWLALIGIVASVISFAYYLRVIVAMYMREPEEPWRLEGASASGALALLLAVLGVLYFGCFPGGLWESIAQGLANTEFGPFNLGG